MEDGGDPFVLDSYSWAWACCGAWWVDLVTLHWRTVIFLAQEVSIADSFWTRDGPLCPHPFSLLGFCLV